MKNRQNTPSFPRAFSILVGLDRKRQRAFLRWLEFESTHQDTDAQRWANLIYTHFEKWKRNLGHKKPRETWVATFEAEFPGQGKRRMQKLNAELSRYLERFLIWEEIEGNPLQQATILLKVMSQVDPEVMYTTLTTVKNRLDRQPLRDVEYHQARLKWVEFRFENGSYLPEKYPVSWLKKGRFDDVMEQRELVRAFSEVLPILTYLNHSKDKTIEPQHEEALEILKRNGDKWPHAKMLHRWLRLFQLQDTPEKYDLDELMKQSEIFKEVAQQHRFGPYWLASFGVMWLNSLNYSNLYEIEHPRKLLRYITQFHVWAISLPFVPINARDIILLIRYYCNLIDLEEDPRESEKLFFQGMRAGKELVEKLDPSRTLIANLVIYLWEAYSRKEEIKLGPIYQKLNEYDVSFSAAFYLFIFRIKLERLLDDPNPQEDELGEFSRECRNLRIRLEKLPEAQIHPHRTMAVRNCLDMMLKLARLPGPEKLDDLERIIKQMRPLEERIWLLIMIDKQRGKGYRL